MWLYTNLIYKNEKNKEKEKNKKTSAKLYSLSRQPVHKKQLKGIQDWSTLQATQQRAPYIKLHMWRKEEK